MKIKPSKKIVTREYSLKIYKTNFIKKKINKMNHKSFKNNPPVIVDLGIG